MSSAIIQLLVLAAVAVFLILRLRSVLGTRDGFERPAIPVPPEGTDKIVPRAEATAPVNGPDHDIIDHVAEGTPAARALAEMKKVESDFSVGEFLRGARGAYEMILMGFQKGQIDEIAPYLAPDVLESFREGLAARAEKGLHVEATFIGLRELSLADAIYDGGTHEAEVTVRFTGELTVAVRDATGALVEGSPTDIRRQHDVWTFGRKMGSDDPNWQLIATGA